MKTQIFRGALAALIAGALLAGCGGVSEMTKDRVARSESAVRQAQETVGNSEQGALELQKARDHLQQARQAIDNKDEEAASRHAQQAELTSELAVARAQSASARRAVEELQASIRTLRQEMERGDPVTATDR